MDKKIRIQNKIAIEKKKRQHERQLLIEQLNAPVNDKLSDESIDKDRERKTILDMVETVTRPFNGYVKRKRNNYRQQFPETFYNEMRRLTNMPKRKDKPHWRPNIFAEHTLMIIYGRFPKGVIAYFNEVNPAGIDGARLFKNHQWLTEIGEKKLTEIIYEAVAMMKKYKYWYEFKPAYLAKYGSTYQPELRFNREVKTDT